MPPIECRFLGTGDAFSASGRHHASYLVSDRNTCIMLDCGATALASLKREGISPDRIDTIIISHLHGDHFSGIPYLFLEFIYQSQRQRPLRIAGPPGTQERVWTLFHTLYRGLASQPLPFRLDFTEMQPGAKVNFDTCAVEPFRVPHQENEISLAMRVRMEGKTIFYSGDTGWTEDLIRYSEGSDLFICECCFFETRVDYHLDYPRIAENRGRFGTKRLILTHLGREVLARRDQLEIEIADEGLFLENV